MVATQFTGEDMVTTVDDSIVVRVSITSSPSSGSKSFSSPPPPLTPKSHHYYADDMYRRQLSPENIRVISQRKLSARKCSLLRALLIQNALPHLETDESEEEKMKDEEAALLAQEARDAGFILNFDEKSHSCRSEPEDKQEEEEEEEEEEKNCEELAIILDASTGRDLDVEEPELVDACYTAAMEALGEIRDSDIIAADAADAACAGRLDMEPVSIIDCSGSGGGGGENDVTSTSATAAITTPTLTTAMTISAAAALSLLTTKNTSAAAVPIKRKRLPTDCDEDLSIKVVAKQARSSSPCGLTERVRSTSSSPSCPTRPVFSVIQC